MTINITVPNTSSDSLTFGSGNTPTAAQVIGIDSGSSNGQLAFNTTASGTSTEAMRINASQNVGIGTTSPSTRLTIGRVDSSNEGGQIDLCRSSDNASAWAIDVFGNTSTPSLRFVDNTAAAERVRIDSQGGVNMGGSTDQTNAGFGISVNSPSYLGANYGRMVIKKTHSGNVTGVAFCFNNSAVGTIAYSDTATTYNTSSDYRLKHDVQPMTGALAKVAALKPVTYKWNADDSEGEGFIAHELAEVVPDCVTGEKDAVDADGNPVYQGIDTSFLVATLTAAIQELKAIVDAQAVEIAALKGTA